MSARRCLTGVCRESGCPVCGCASSRDVLRPDMASLPDVVLLQSTCSECGHVLQRFVAKDDPAALAAGQVDTNGGQTNAR